MNDNFNQLVADGIQIYGSREKIRSQLIDQAKDYLQLKSVDLYKTSILSYIIDTLSILSANHYFYDSTIYREFFMVEAQMSESVYNLVRWIGYAPPKAQPSTVDILFTIPLSFDSSNVSFNIPNTFKAIAGSIPFTINTRPTNTGNTASAKILFDKTAFTADIIADPSILGNIINSSAITVTDSNGFQKPVVISQDGKNASFMLPFTQHERTVLQFLIPSELQPYQFYSKILDFNGMVSSVKVWVAEPSYGEKIDLDTSKSQDFFVGDDRKSTPGNAVVRSFGTTKNTTDQATWTQWTESADGIYTMAPNATEFVFVSGTNKGELFFGNGILGKQPIANSAITVELFITKGEDGVIIPYSINQGEKLYYTDENIQNNLVKISKLKTIAYTITNPGPSIGGVNTPTLPEVKQNAIINLRSKQKLVSDTDYDDINVIMGSDFPVVEAFPILKRSDLKVNEIMLFTRLLYHDKLNQPQIVPTRNTKFSLYDPEFVDDKYTVLRTTPITIDEENYQTMFNMTIDKPRMMAYYDYVLQNVTGTPATLYTDGQYSFYNSYIYMPVNNVDFNVQLSAEDSSSSSSVNNTTYALNVKVNVNHIPNANAPNDYQFSEFRCRMITKWDTNQEYEQLYASVDNSSGNGLAGKYSYFSFEIPNYLTVPSGIQRFEFDVDGYGFLRAKDSLGNWIFVDENGDPINSTDLDDAVEGWIPFEKYYVDVMVRKDLSDVMFSTVTKTNYWDGQTHENSLKWDIHNVPVILSDYLDDGSGNGVLTEESDAAIYPNFEVVVLQSFVNSLDLASKRMLTDSINVKFPNTHGKLKNLKYNPYTDTINSRFKTPFSSVEVPIGITFKDGETFPGIPSTGTVKYIVNGKVTGYESYDLSSYIDSIAELYRGGGEGGVDIWYLTKPTRGQYILVEDELDDDENEKILVYTGSEWKDAQDFDIPLKLKLKVEMNPTVTMSSNKLKELIKTTIVNKLSPYMGVQKELDRSVIVTLIRSLPQVKYCELSEPEIDIKFLYDIRTDLTQSQLIDYTPDYVGVDTSNIDVEIES